MSINSIRKHLIIYGYIVALVASSVILVDPRSVLAGGPSGACTDENLRKIVNQEDEYLYLAAFLNDTCLDSVNDIDLATRVRIAEQLGDLDYLLGVLPQDAFIPYVESLASFGNRYAVRRAENSVEFLINLSDRSDMIERQRYLSIASFLASSLPNSESLGAHNAQGDMLEKYLSFVNLDSEGRNEFQTYCLSENCSADLSERDFCNFQFPISMKSEFLRSESEFFKKLKRCDFDNLQKVAALRSIGIADGQCSLYLQTAGFERGNSMALPDCNQLLLQLYDFPSFVHDDGVLLLRSLGSEANPEIRIPKSATRAVRMLLSVWPELKNRLVEN